MVSSANLLMLFIFWQLLTWLLYLLSHHYAHPETMEGAFKTCTLLRVGDVAFLSGIVLAHALYGTLEFQQLFIRAAEDPITVSLWPGSGLEISAVTVITLLIFIGAMSKSAQFPLHMWLPDSLYAPTPVHALLHAGIINSGGFLLNRLAPLYGLSPTTLHLVFAIGAMTALLGAGMMLTQNDIKKTLGYSTIGQMGYMIMECGLGAFALAVFHLIAHGLFKATIFLNCGHVIHAARQEPRLPPKDETVEQTDFSLLTWLTGFITTLILPLIILLAAHGVLSLPLRNSQGVVIFLFFMNRLYVDALALRLGRGFTRVAHRLDTSRLFPYVAGLIALGLVLPAAVWTGELSAANITLFFVVALMIPLFPLHGVYVAALTRLPGYLPMCLAILLPTVGLYGLMGLLPEMPAEFLKGVSVLALFGALYGSLKALVQFRVTRLLAYASLAFFSILWWYLAVTGTSTPQAAVYTSAVALVIGGLLLACHRVQVRYFDLDLNQIGGLAPPLPPFPIFLSLLVMADVGLPPFGLFSGYMAILLHPSIVISWDLMVILLTWLAASWYLFRLMQRLLFGPHRSDIRYEDLRPTEVAPLLIVLLILLALGITPYGFFESDTLTNSYRTAMELMLWNK